MFIPKGTPPQKELRPANSHITHSDWAILADYWYPIAISADVADRPVAAKLLDIDLVLFRNADGDAAVLLDTCPHRHVRLSAGQVIGGEIECPFHGLRFNASGQCSRVPALGRQVALPSKYQVDRFPVSERYGLVWTCLGDANKNGVPEFPSLSSDDPAEFAFSIPAIWPVSAPRQIENFVDLAHLPFIHATTLGGEKDSMLKPGKIVQGDGCITSRTIYVETGHDGAPRPTELTYRIVLPFAVEFRTQSIEKPDEYFESVDIPSPTSAYECLVFQLIKSPKGKADAQQMTDFLIEVNQQDIDVLSTLQRPSLPLDQHHEIHLPVDNISIAFRKRLEGLGLGNRTSA